MEKEKEKEFLLTLTETEISLILFALKKSKGLSWMPSHPFNEKLASTFNNITKQIGDPEWKL